MKKSISALLILVASTMATAAEPVSASAKPIMVLAYNQIDETKFQEATVEYASRNSAERFLERNLDVVAASLNIELNDKIISAMTPRIDK